MDYRDSPCRGRVPVAPAQHADVLPEFSDSDGGRATLYKTSRTRQWQRLLHDACYIGRTWPTKIGGSGPS
jgi:hypothetical protein